MLKKIKNFFDERLIPGAVSGDLDTEHVLRLAIGALLLEMTHMDGEVWPEQRKALLEKTNVRGAPLNERFILNSIFLTEPYTRTVQ